jgi:hypothetical protein
VSEILAGGTLIYDPSDKRLLVFDWDRYALVSGLSITDSDWTITVVRQNGATALTNDNEGIVSGNRKTQTRLLATTAAAGDIYWVSNKITTDGSPAQEIEQRFKVVVQNQ